MQIEGLVTTGDGIDGRVIDPSYPPDVVMVKREEGISGGGPYISSRSMPADTSKNMFTTDAPEANHIQSFTATGITIGHDRAVNSGGSEGATGGTFHWLFLKMHPSDSNYGTYEGNSTDNTEITPATYTPNVVIIWSNGAELPVFAISTDAADVTRLFTGNANVAGRIKALINGGFRLGVHPQVNATGTTYYYAMWKDVAGFMKAVGYEGTGVDHDELGTGFDPDHAVTKSSGTPNAYWHPLSIGKLTDLSLPFSSGGAIANIIEGLITDGINVGTGSGANSNTVVYGGFQLKEGNSVPPAVGRSQAVIIS